MRRLSNENIRMRTATILVATVLLLLEGTSTDAFETIELAKGKATVPVKENVPFALCYPSTVSVLQDPLHYLTNPLHLQRLIRDTKVVVNTNNPKNHFTFAKPENGESVKEALDSLECGQAEAKGKQALSFSVRPFSDTCIVICPAFNGGITTVTTSYLSQTRVLLWVAGLFLIFSADSLSKSILLYYSVSTTFGVVLLVVGILIIVSRYFNRFVPSWASFAGGIFVFFGFSTGKSYLQMPELTAQEFYQQLRESPSFPYIAGTAAALPLISFAVAYWRGPPGSRMQDIIQVVIQLAGSALQVIATQDFWTGVAIAMINVSLSYGLGSLVLKIILLPLIVCLYILKILLIPLRVLPPFSYVYNGIVRFTWWWRSNPVLISEDEYEAQKTDYTERALRELRESVAQDKSLLNRLKRGSRRNVHAFIGGADHITEEEVEEWDHWEVREYDNRPVYEEKDDEASSSTGAQDLEGVVRSLSDKDLISELGKVGVPITRVPREHRPLLEGRLLAMWRR